MKYNLSNIARRANALTRTMNQSAACQSRGIVAHHSEMK